MVKLHLVEIGKHFQLRIWLYKIVNDLIEQL